MTVLRIDVETYSSGDLRKAGAAKYFEADDFEITLFGYAFDDEPAQVVDLAGGEELPGRIADALQDPAILKTAYNAAFEIGAIGTHFGLALDVAQWQCTSVHALYLGLPGNLGDVGKVLGLAEDKAKLASGGALIRYFCLPCRPTKTNGGRTRNLPHHDPAKWQLFKEYCARDVEAEREISRRLARFPVPAKEWRLWHLDQRMLARGTQIDRELVAGAIELDTQVREALTTEAVQLTGLDNPNSRDQLITWLEAEMDDEVADLTKKSVPKLLAATDSAVVQRVLQIRQELAKTSVSKYHSMDRAVCADGAIRGLTQFYGANRTGRWAGRIVQVQNLVSNRLRDLDLARDLVKQRRADDIEMLFGSVADTLSQLIRTAFVARPGHLLMPADFSAIEARVIAWMADCKWRLDVFATHGKIYEASAEQMFKLPAGSVGKKSPYRQKGKIAELALGYQGGAGALKTMGALEMGIPEEELDGIKDAWRAANPEIVQLWRGIERQAIAAVANRVTTTLPIAGGKARLRFSCEAGMLFIELPSGRRLAYVKARIEEQDLYRTKADGGTFMVASAGSLTYEGNDQKTKQWVRLATYGGKLVENITQAIARDCLAEAMLALDNVGVDQLFTVHDEIVCEVDPQITTLKEIEEVMGRPISWAPGLLLRADGFQTNYYMKEVD